MSEHMHSNPEAIPASSTTEETFGSIWQKYCADPESGHSNMPSIRRKLNHWTARLKYRHVRLINFEQLCCSGYDVQKFDDVAALIEPEKTDLQRLPENWKTPQQAFVPMISKLKGAVVFGIGATLLPDKRLLLGNRARTMPPEFGSGVKEIVYSDRSGVSALIHRHMRCMDLPGRCFSARHRPFWNFGHFVHDILSLIYYEDLGAIVPGRDKVIAPPMPWPMQKALFHKVFDGYEIVQTPLHIPLRVEELLVPEILCNVRAGCNPAAIRSLALRMRRIVTPYAGRDRRKICVSRRDGRPFEVGDHAFRNFANVDAYETMLRKMGYDVMEVSALDPESQFSMWANTTDIVGIHGAGMMNMIMMPPGGNYTEIAADINRSCTVRCAIAAGQRVGVLENGARDAQGSLVIDLDRLEALLLDAP